MIPLSLAQIAAVTGGTVCGDPALVVTDPAYLDSRSPLVLGEPGTASMSDQDRQQAVTALAAMIHRWRLNNRDRSADASVHEPDVVTSRLYNSPVGLQEGVILELDLVELLPSQNFLDGLSHFPGHALNLGAILRSTGCCEDRQRVSGIEKAGLAGYLRFLSGTCTWRLRILPPFWVGGPHEAPHCIGVRLQLSLLSPSFPFVPRLLTVAKKGPAEGGRATDQGAK